MTPKIVYTCGGGRLGNQLLNYAHLLAFSLEHSHFDVLDLAFLPYVEEYGNEGLELASIRKAGLSCPWARFVRTFWGDSFLKPWFSTYPVNRFRLQSIHGAAQHRSSAQSILGGDTHVYYPLPGDRRERLLLDDPATVETLEARPLSILAGWNIRAWPLVDKHRQTIRNRLKPGEMHRSAATSYVSTLREDHDLVVGALLRQGDYRTHLGGKYFFESVKYREFMDAYAEDRPENEVGFLIASDEAQSADVFDEAQYHFATGEAVGPNSYVENFAELMKCDVILTPPSTFSVLAGFLGDVPIVPLYDGMETKTWETLERPLFDAITHSVWSEDIEY